jgi:Restriction endonuclease
MGGKYFESQSELNERYSRFINRFIEGLEIEKSNMIKNGSDSNKEFDIVEAYCNIFGDESQDGVNISFFMKALETMEDNFDSENEEEQERILLKIINYNKQNRLGVEVQQDNKNNAPEEINNMTGTQFEKLTANLSKNDIIVGKCDTLDKQIKKQLQLYPYKELCVSGENTKITLGKLARIYSDIYKDECLETENIFIFKTVLEQTYGFKFGDNNSIQNLIQVLEGFQKVRKNRINRNSVNRNSVNLGISVASKYNANVDINNVQKMTGVEFEELISNLLIKMGLEVETTKTTGDGGIDLIGYNKQTFFGGKYIVQCKRWNGSVGEPPVRDLYGVVMSENANKGILITNSNFTSNAVKFANNKPIELIDGQMLQQLLEKYNIVISETPTYEDDSLKDIYDWDKITLIRSELRNNHNNHNLRMQLIDELSYNLYKSSGVNNYSRRQLLAMCELLEEQLQIFGNIKYSPANKNLNFLKYTSYVAQAQVNLIRGDINSSIRNLNKVFEWEEVRDTIEKDNNLEDLYLYSAYNMVQLLYFIGLDSKAKSFKLRHYKVFNENIKRAERIVRTPTLSPNTKKFFEDLAYNLENCIYTKEFCKFEYNWSENIDDANHIYQELGGGTMGYCCYSMGTGTSSIKFDTIFNGVYSKIFDLDESKLSEWKKTFSVII